MSSNHKAIIAQITSVISIPNADSIHIGMVLGEQVIVSKSWDVGFVGVFFPVDVQLSEEFCRQNNLYRHSHLNIDQEKKGFFDDNRRVRAQPFLKVRSCGFFAGLECLDFTGVSIDNAQLSLGSSFDELNGVKLCQKYMNEKTRIAGQANKNKAVKVNKTPFFMKHVDSEQFKHAAQNIPTGALLSFHAKLHGTSARMAKTLVEQELPLWKRALNKIAPFFPTEKWDYVVGTRNVVISDGAKEGFHGSEQFRFDALELVKPFLDKGMTVYGELAGFANGTSIMPKHSIKALKDKAFSKKYGDEVTYSYGCKEHQCRFHVYRITYLNHEGENVDFSQKQLEKWCADRGILSTLEVFPQMVYDGDVERLRGLVELLTERPDDLTEDYIDPSHVSEGIIVRVDAGGMTPKFYKSKSYAFRAMEGMCEVADPESIS